MNTIKCGIGECPSVFKTEDVLSPNARYVCKLHTEHEQRIFFQDFQFDKDLGSGAAPVGTAHIPFQADKKHPNGTPPSRAVVKKEHERIEEDVE